MRTHSEKYRPAFCPPCVLFLMLIAVFVPACRPSVGELDRRELDDPAAALAAERLEAGDVAGAIAIYRTVLDENPQLARLHLEVAFLYDARAGDYVRAVYHYQRYLELRPQTEKRGMLAERIEKARKTLAAEYGRDAEVLQERIAVLEAEKESLLEAKESLRRELEERRSAETPETGQPFILVVPGKPLLAGPGLQPFPGTGTVPLSPSGNADLRYIVRGNDSLSSLARRFYGDARQWPRIYQANRELVDDPNILPVGVEIVIPGVPSAISGNRP